jgi:signal peptidase I
LIVFAVQFTVFVTFYGYQPTSVFPIIAALLVVIGILIALPIILIRKIMHASSWQALRAWLPPTVAVPVFGALLALLVVRPFIFQAFFVPTNGMAPNILGSHFVVTCPICGKQAYGSPPPRGADHFECLTICSEYHVHTAIATSSASEGDRFMVAKYLRPRRWDVLCFRYPGDPSMIYIKRLVGLPGESVFIKDGAVWINGQQIEPPPLLHGLNYVTEIPHLMPQMQVWGAPEQPARLGSDEYFVLGDFSPNSSDSRLWATGAPGHPAYAVPESYIIGVGTHIYWPPSRWRILR